MKKILILIKIKEEVLPLVILKLPKMNFKMKQKFHL